MPSGIETLHPDVYVVEVSGTPRVIGVGVNTGGMIGVAEKGPVDRAILITNTQQFNDNFGGFFQGSYLEPSVRAFFNNGGSRMFAVRIVGLGALPSSGTLSNHENLPTIDVDAANPGAWGDQVSLKTERYRTTISTAVGPNPLPVPSPVPPVVVGSTFVALASVRGVQRGDLIVVTDPAGGGKAQGFVIAVYSSVRTVQVTALLPQPGSPPLPPIFPVGSLVQCATSHRATTTSTQSLVLGQTSMTVQSVFNIVIGSRVLVADPLTGFYTSVLVTAVDGLTLRFAAAAPPAPLAVGSVVVSEEFDLRIFEKGILRAIHEFIAVEPTNQRDYFGIRLAGQSNESKVISVTDLLAAPTDLLHQIPQPIEKLALGGGTDGATPTDADYIGSDVMPKSGIYLFDEIDEVNFISTPGVTAVSVTSNGVDYAENRGEVMYVAETPLAADEPQEALDYREFQLNRDSSYTALYYPWLIVRDPVVGNQRIAMPPTGYVQGSYALVGQTRGVHVAPANLALRGVLDLTHNTTNGEQDLLNPQGVNVIRAFPGEGIRIWGARTLFSLKDGRHYVPVRRLLNFVKESIQEGNRFAVFEPIDPRLFTLLRRVNEEFLHSLWLRGQLFPSTDESRAFFVKCDEENNPTSEIREGRVNVEIGINPPFPAEFIIFRIGIFDGGTTVEEEIARRG